MRGKWTEGEVHTEEGPGPATPKTCCRCGALFPRTKSGPYCPPCHLNYDRTHRARRRAEGNPVVGKRKSLESERAYAAKYRADPKNRAREAEKQRRYREDPAKREQFVARDKARHAISSGKLIRRPCEVCGEPKTDAHHDDYSRPLDVRWLCRTHHAAHHASLRAPADTEPSRGEKNGRARLTAAQAAEIRALERPASRGAKGAGHPNSLKAIAARYGVGVSTVSELLSGKSWTDVSTATADPNSTDGES